MRRFFQFSSIAEDVAEFEFAVRSCKSLPQAVSDLPGPIFSFHGFSSHLVYVLSHGHLTAVPNCTAKTLRLYLLILPLKQRGLPEVS